MIRNPWVSGENDKVCDDVLMVCLLRGCGFLA